MAATSGRLVALRAARNRAAGASLVSLIVLISLISVVGGCKKVLPCNGNRQVIDAAAYFLKLKDEPALRNSLAALRFWLKILYADLGAASGLESWLYAAARQ